MRIHKHIAIRRSSGAGVLEKWDLKRTIEPPGPDDGQSGRQREILPLPLWADGKEELRNLFDPETSENSVGLKRRPADMQGVPVY